MAKRILITGASGFVGWNAVRHFAESGHDVVATYCTFSHYLHRVVRCQPVRLDLADGSAIDDVVARFQPDCIVHAAAISRPQESHDAEQLQTVNVLGTERLARAAARAGSTFVFLSTDLVYDSQAGCCTERTPTHPSGAGGYSRSKLAAEHAVANAGCRWIVLRCALLFGNGTPRSNSFTQFIDRCWAQGKAAPVFTDQYRSFLYVGELVRAVEHVALVNPQANELFVCGGPERLSRAEFAMRYADAAGRDRAMCHPMRSAELPGYQGGGSDIWLDTAKLRATGWEHRPVVECFQEMLMQSGLE